MLGGVAYTILRLAPVMLSLSGTLFLHLLF